MQAWSYLGRRSVRSSTMSPIDQARATCCTVCPVYRARHSPDSRCRAIPPFSHRPSAEKGLSAPTRSEEHTSELQSLMRRSYAVFCLNKTLNRIIYLHLYANITNKLL